MAKSEKNLEKKSEKSNTKNISVKLLKSLSGRKQNHISCAKGLGLKRIHQTVMVMDTLENRGMINEIYYLVSWKVNK